MLLALLLVVYIGAIGVAAGVLLVAIEPTVGWPGCSGFSSWVRPLSGVEPVAQLRCLIVSLATVDDTTIDPARSTTMAHRKSLGP
jgi:hypothetical protein